MIFRYIYIYIICIYYIYIYMLDYKNYKHIVNYRYCITRWEGPRMRQTWKSVANSYVDHLDPVWTRSLPKLFKMLSKKAGWQLPHHKNLRSSCMRMCIYKIWWDIYMCVCVCYCMDIYSIAWAANMQVWAHFTSQD